MISIFIVDDHAMIVEGLMAMLQDEQGIRIAGYATNGEACINFVKHKTADVILMDISMPGMSGMDLCKEIKTNYPGIQVIALSTYNQGSFISRMMENGASGYLLKNAEKKEILHAIKEVMAGRQYLSFEAGKNYQDDIEKKQNSPLLTKREKEILKLIVEGFTNAQISKQLFISVDTVDTHRKNLYLKLNVNNTAQLIKSAIMNDLLG
jgi:DNA-binding NarL/FixJ family response regulator